MSNLLLLLSNPGFESIYYLKVLQEDYGYNLTINSYGQTVNWNNIKITKKIPLFKKNNLYKVTKRETVKTREK